ncbi:hypothetical protein BQ8794_290150 [Mesorhizobium prunaredense]|uniref:Uncharacterized protein n=1 Tax=Mesorhizobium prunaredense TaxID=1631249 RepID=A0A1R3VDR3_9HYPH|nr:hypothetical protein BQ8794_290150 [Mesorhizobium prunaredense]
MRRWTPTLTLPTRGRERCRAPKISPLALKGGQFAEVSANGSLPPPVGGVRGGGPS